MRGPGPRGPAPQRRCHPSAGNEDLLHDLDVAHSDIEALHQQLEEDQVPSVEREGYNLVNPICQATA